mmetsp:Transcript_100252/g.288019  ORF Transcript_100252/g.288019 Transcript_100252/m.288019 type:complete len:219 (-) Transcript_100252:165-821(-)
MQHDPQRLRQVRGLGDGAPDSEPDDRFTRAGGHHHVQCHDHSLREARGVDQGVRDLGLAHWEWHRSRSHHIQRRHQRLRKSWRVGARARVVGWDVEEQFAGGWHDLQCCCHGLRQGRPVDAGFRLAGLDGARWRPAKLDRAPGVGSRRPNCWAGRLHVLQRGVREARRVEGVGRPGDVAQKHCRHTDSIHRKRGAGPWCLRGHFGESARKTSCVRCPP